MYIRAGMVLALAIVVAAEAQVKAPAFEVVSVKPHLMPPNQLVLQRYTGLPGLTIQNNRFKRRTISLQDLIMQAYGVYDYQVSGLPDWAIGPGGDYFDVEATIDPDMSPAPEQLRTMVQALLAERFKLTIHHESKETSVYELVVGKSGVRFRQLREDEEIETFASIPPERPTQTGIFDEIVAVVRMLTDRPLLDRTGITGRFEYASPRFKELLAQRRSDPVEAQASLEKWIQTLGLQLQSRRRNIEMLRVDHAEKPSPN